MFEVVLFQPEIPPNTGNVIRMCANAGARLHLVEPLGFSMEDRLLRRAGLDYHELTSVTLHPGWESCRDALRGRRMFALTTRARARYDQVQFAPGDVFVFGPETAGLSESVLAGFPDESRLRIPMMPGNRSLNLSNAAAVVIFEAWRQNGFVGCRS